MKILILTCENAVNYLEANILPFLEGTGTEIIWHRVMKGKPNSKEYEPYDVVILACDDFGFKEKYELTYLEIKAKTKTDLPVALPVADLRVLDQEYTRMKTSPEEMRKVVARAVFLCVLQAKPTEKVLRSLIKLSLS